MAQAERSQYVAGDIDIARQSFGLTQQALDLNRDQLAFNRKMLVANTVIQGAQLALDATKLGFQIAETVQNNRALKQDRVSEDSIQQMYAGYETAPEQGFSLWEKNEDGSYKTVIDADGNEQKVRQNWDNVRTPDGKTIGEHKAIIEENVRSKQILKTKWGQDKYLDKLNDRFTNNETAAMAKIAIRELNTAKALEVQNLEGLQTRVISDGYSNNKGEKLDFNSSEYQAKLADDIRYELNKTQIRTPEQLDIATAQQVKRFNDNTISSNATGLATNQQYAEARETVAKASEAGLINADTKENTLKNITEIQRQSNLDTWGEARNQVLGAGNPWQRLEAAREQELRFREGGELDANYADQQDAQATHHQWFIKEIENLEDETKVRATRGKEDREEDKMKQAYKILEILERGKDGKGNNYTYRDADRDILALDLESQNHRKIMSEIYKFQPPFIKDVVIPKLDAILKPLEDDLETKEEAWNIRQSFNDDLFNGRIPDQKSANEKIEEYKLLASAKIAGKAGRKLQNIGALNNTEKTVTDEKGRVTNISIRHDEKNDLRTSNQSILERNIKNTTWQVGEGSRTDGTFTLTDNITKERLTARVGNNGKPEVMVNGSWQSFDEHKEKGIVRRMEQIYNREISDDQRQQIDKLRTQGAKTNRANPTVQGAFEAELRKIMGGAVIQREWWEEFKSREWEKYRDKWGQENKNPHARRTGGNR